MGQFNFEEAYNLFRELALISPQNTELQTNMAIALINISPDILLSVDDNQGDAVYHPATCLCVLSFVYSW